VAERKELIAITLVMLQGGKKILENHIARGTVNSTTHLEIAFNEQWVEPLIFGNISRKL
jgi:hypothetical protein